MDGPAPIAMPGRSRAYDTMVTHFLAHGRETPMALQQALDAHPEDCRLHAARALLLVTLARNELDPPARQAARQAQVLAESPPTGMADRAFVAAAIAAADGAWRRAIDHLEAALMHDPSDSLAAKMSHALRFMLGDKAGMLHSITRVLRHLPQGHAHEGFLLGCRAFALEENGRYAEAEIAGRHAVEIEPRDAWGLHAVSHVHEMTGRARDGIAWIERGESRFAACNNFGYHLYWHLALFKLETGAVADAFALYDRHVRGDRTDDFRDIANGASMLMRLELDGHDVGDRWEELADKAEARLEDRSLVFADLHYLMALIGAGRHDSARVLARSIACIAPRHAAQQTAVEEAGEALADGLVRFSEGDMEGALARLLAARPARHALGGSDAQRDVFEQITIEAALRAADMDAARVLLAERLAGRRRNRFAETRLARLAARPDASRGALGIAAALAFARPAH